jgi:DUF4097 and DUF4098 domain-containing protein YvlB
VFRNFGAGGPKAEISIAVPRDIALTLGVVSAGALISGIRNDAKLNTVSGDIIADGISGDLTANSVSGDVQIRGLVGSVVANSVSGDVAVTGTLRKATIDTVSGSELIDAIGDANTVNLNTVSGGVTVRLDETLPANYVLRSVSGKLMVDGIQRSSGGPSNYSGQMGELAGRFVDVRANTVSGGITVLRRPQVSVADDAEWEES